MRVYFTVESDRSNHLFCLLFLVRFGRVILRVLVIHVFHGKLPYVDHGTLHFRYLFLETLTIFVQKFFRKALFHWNVFVHVQHFLDSNAFRRFRAHADDRIYTAQLDLDHILVTSQATFPRCRLVALRVYFHLCSRANFFSVLGILEHYRSRLFHFWVLALKLRQLAFPLKLVPRQQPHGFRSPLLFRNSAVWLHFCNDVGIFTKILLSIV